MSHTVFSTDGCRTLKFKPPFHGSYLEHHVYKSYIIKLKDDCELKCYIDDDCMSTNVGILETGQYLCELSDSDHELHPEDLQIRERFIYTATEVRSLLIILERILVIKYNYKQWQT